MYSQNFIIFWISKLKIFPCKIYDNICESYLFIITTITCWGAIEKYNAVKLLLLLWYRVAVAYKPTTTVHTPLSRCRGESWRSSRRLESPFNLETQVRYRYQSIASVEFRITYRCIRYMYQSSDTREVHASSVSVFPFCSYKEIFYIISHLFYYPLFLPGYRSQYRSETASEFNFNFFYSIKFINEYIDNENYVHLAAWHLLFIFIFWYFNAVLQVARLNININCKSDLI